MLCQLCGEPMPSGEEMFKYHGYSGPCPKPPMRQAEFTDDDAVEKIARILALAAGYEVTPRVPSMVKDEEFPRVKQLVDIARFALWTAQHTQR